MTAVKVEIDVDSSSLNHFSNDNSCLICLQSVKHLNKEPFNSLNLFLNYLKIEDEIKSAFVCEKCVEIITKLVKLSNNLEKVRLEMDYLLGIIQSVIINSNSLEYLSPAFNSVRKSLIKRCAEKIISPKPKIILQRIEVPKLLKTDKQSPVDYSKEWGPDWDDDGFELNLEDTPTIPTHKTKRKRAKCLKTKKLHLKAPKDPVESGSKPFKCPTCPKSFRHQSHLRIHINGVHLHLRPYRCDVCSESFASFTNLKYHKAKGDHKPNQTKREILNPKKFSCQLCDKTFTRLHFLNRHVSVTHERQRYSCQAPECDTSYLTKYSLLRHYKLEHPIFPIPKFPRRKPTSKYSDKFTTLTENGQNVIKCLLCNGTFKTLASVKIHIVTVHGPKQFVCESCGYATAIKFQLERHIEGIHNKPVVKNAQCNFCPKQFAAIYLVKKHIRTAHGEKKFKCQECNYSATFKQRLNIHVKRKHKDQSGEKVVENAVNIF